MAKIEIQIEDGILTVAEKVLHSLGMDVEMAVSIYLRRIALEKGLPMNMTGPASKRSEPEITENFEDSFEDDSKASTRSNSRITTAMVDEVWYAFLRHVGGSGEINPLSTEVSTKTGMNRGSAFIYLTVLSNLVNGDPNTRVLKYRDLEYLMGKIKTELGESKYQKALKSLMASVPYWREKIPGAFADKVEAYCKKNL
jgi:antitoxin component of RelBE/YafQ-DinJ toxin-antitoxin module